MAKITALDVAENLTGDEFLPIVQGPTTKRVTMSAFRSLITPYLQNWYRGDKGDTGAADNTYGPENGGLAAFRASDIARGAASLVGIPDVADGRFYWTLGDYTDQDDGQHIIAADSTPLSIGAWLRDKGDGTINVLSFIPRHLHRSIARRVPNNSRSAAERMSGYFQAAIDDASARRRPLIVPAGLYNIAPREYFKAEAGDIVRCFAIRSYMNIVGEIDTTLRIVDGISSDANPVFMAMFGTNEILRDVTWRDLELDMNGANNLFSPNRDTPSLPHNGYNLFNQAAIHVTGTSDDGKAARINNATVENTRFVNCYGVSCLVMGQSNSTDSGMGLVWTVRFCHFLEGGLDTVDHSAVYGWAEYVTATYNRFANKKQFDQNGGLVAFEIHGTHAIFAYNRVSRFFQGLWIDGNSSAISYNVQVLNNTFDEIGAFGILFFGQSANAAPVRGTLIQGNGITLDDTVYPGIDLKFGIGTAGQYSQSEVTAVDNSVRGIGTRTAKAGAVITAGTIVGQKHDRWVIERLMSENVTAGVALFTNATVGLGTIEIRGCKATNLVRAGALNVPQGIAVSTGGALIDHLILIDNDCLDDRLTEDAYGPTQTAFGIRLEGPVNRLTKYGNRARGATVDYAETGFTAMSRKGLFRISTPYNLGALAPGAKTYADIVVANSEMDDMIAATMNVDLAEVDIRARMKTPGLLRVWFRNEGADAFPGANGTIVVTHDKMA